MAPPVTYTVGGEQYVVVAAGLGGTHGGVLDVYDAFIFIAPVFYFYLMVTGGLSA